MILFVAKMLALHFHASTFIFLHVFLNLVIGPVVTLSFIQEELIALMLVLFLFGVDT